MLVNGWESGLLSHAIIDDVGVLDEAAELAA
jgi:hypothetical protein